MFGKAIIMLRDYANAHAQTHVLPPARAKEGGVSIFTEAMYLRHKLLKKLTLLFLLLSAGLWSIRVAKIRWDPCKSHKMARELDHHALTAKGVELAVQGKLQMHNFTKCMCLHRWSGHQSVFMQVSIPGLRTGSTKLLVYKALYSRLAMQLQYSIALRNNMTVQHTLPL